jgi:2-amino-4-hydroxy-6-hydroxymethyldihydropteridine diphosphokinase
MNHMCYVGLGSNLEDPKMQVLRAIQECAAIRQTQFQARSKLYLTSPMGPQNQADMINAVIALQTQLSPMELLKELQHIESRHGRRRCVRWGPRTLDLDLLLYDDLVSDDPQLTIPHPGLLERDFVLQPLAEIAPTLKLPNGKTAKQQLSEVPIFIIEPLQEDLEICET